MAAAAEFVNGGIWIDQYQPEILDLVRRDGVLGQRIRFTPATGAISRWFDQTAIGAAKFDNPRSLTPTASSPTRGEKALTVKGITNRVVFGLFEQEVSALQPASQQLKSKDIMDMLNGIIRLHHRALWQGTDVVDGGLVGKGTTEQYVGITKQIGGTTTVVAEGSSIVDAIRLDVAKMMADSDNQVRPTAVYLNPLTLHLIENEMKAANNTIAKVQVVAGVEVPAIMTAAGLLPLIPDIDLSTDLFGGTPAEGKTHYPYVIVTENLIEYHYIGSQTPRIYQLGLVSNLAEDYVGVMFGAPVVKAGNLAHRKGYAVRPTL